MSAGRLFLVTLTAGMLAMLTVLAICSGFVEIPA